MLNPNKQIREDGIELLGELHPLLEQLGTADGLFCVNDASMSLQLGAIRDAAGLGEFLRSYRGRVLLPLDLPSIHRAHGYACQNGCRELIELDRKIAGEPVLRDFSSASRRVGQSWLKRLRPLRGERVVQRYLQAVEAGGAQGWHTVVYGITLAMYSLPVRQGLLNYARQTLRGFITSASHPLRLSRDQSVALFDESCVELPRLLESVLGSKGVSA